MGKKIDLKARLEASVKEGENGCRIWQKKTCLDKKGYAHIWVDGKSKRIHQAVYEFFVGPVPEGQYLTRTCGQKLCGNINHIKPKTRSEITNESIKKGRKKQDPRIMQQYYHSRRVCRLVQIMISELKAKGINNKAKK